MREATADHKSQGELSGAIRYQAEIDLSNGNSAHTQQVLLIGEHKTILEIGPATGHMTRFLRERGCRVTAIERDSEASERAKPFCERMVVGDVEGLDLRDTLGDARFDVVLFGDVLEHLVDPRRTLLNIRPFLTEDGCVIASIPNVAHGSIRLALLAGRFRYTELGLLDRTHLRFFDRAGVEELFLRAGFVIRDWRRSEIDVLDTEVDIPPDAVPPHLIQAIRAAPEALTYQFIVRAEPAHDYSSPPQTDPAKQEAIASLTPLWQAERRTRDLEARDTVMQQELAVLQQELAVLQQELAVLRSPTHTLGYRALKEVYRSLQEIAPKDTRRRKAVSASVRAALQLLNRRRRGAD